MSLPIIIAATPGRQENQKSSAIFPVTYRFLALPSPAQQAWTLPLRSSVYFRIHIRPSIPRGISLNMRCLQRYWPRTPWSSALALVGTVNFSQICSARNDTDYIGVARVTVSSFPSSVCFKHKSICLAVKEKWKKTTRDAQV